MRLGLVGPLPPPNGGMAMQTLQLARLLAMEGLGRGTGADQCALLAAAWWKRSKACVRCFVSCPIYGAYGDSPVAAMSFILMANSGWSWQLFAAPVIWIGWLRKTPVIVNYRGGEAREYLAASARWVKPSIERAARLVVPSGFLQQVFSEVGLSQCHYSQYYRPGNVSPRRGAAPCRAIYPGHYPQSGANLWPGYGYTGVRPWRAKRFPDIALKIAGSGPQHAELEALVEQLGLSEAVLFLGRLERSEIVALYHSAHAMLNPSRVDNMPNSVLEALACGVARDIHQRGRCSLYCAGWADSGIGGRRR